MGDRCSLEMTVRKQDRDRVIEVMGEPEFENDPQSTLGPNLLDLSWAQKNHRGASDRLQLTNEGIPFVGWHGPGDNYGEFVFASCDRVMKECPKLTIVDRAEPVVVVRQDHEGLLVLDPQMATLASDYWDQYNLAIKALKGEAS